VRLGAARASERVVMMKRLQTARQKILSIHEHGEKLESVVGLSPFMQQEFDT
jgi:hypothetical protein